MRKTLAILFIAASVAAGRSTVFAQSPSGTEGGDRTRHVASAAHMVALTGMEGGSAGAEHDNPGLMYPNPDHGTPGH